MEQNESPRLTALMGELKDGKQLRAKWEKLEAFQLMLNQAPPDGAIEATPDGKARTMVISHVENALDTYYLGQWSTKNFRWEVMQNELAATIELEVVHPITGATRTVIGAAATAIMVDRAPEELKGRERNAWALDVNNKKPAALKMDLPKLKAECLKNAAIMLGRAFGKDLNRKNSAGYQPKMGKPVTRLPKSWVEGAKAAIASGGTTFDQVIERLELEGVNIPEDQLVDLNKASKLQLNGH